VTHSHFGEHWWTTPVDFGARSACPCTLNLLDGKNLCWIKGRTRTDQWRGMISVCSFVKSVREHTSAVTDERPAMNVITRDEAMLRLTPNVRDAPLYFRSAAVTCSTRSIRDFAEDEKPISETVGDGRTRWFGCVGSRRAWAVTPWPYDHAIHANRSHKNARSEEGRVHGVVTMSFTLEKLINISSALLPSVRFLAGLV